MTLPNSETALQETSHTSPLTDKERIKIVEELTDHSFAEPTLVLRALTHPSAVERRPLESYERLEFLGDAVLSLVVGEEAYRRFPDADEGMLTKIRIALVSGETLRRVSMNLRLDRLIVLGSSEQSAASRGMGSALEDVFEALVGALYLDGGFDIAAAWILQVLGENITREAADEATSPKSQLQERMQAAGKRIKYRVVSRSGPVHAPHFTAEVLLDKKLSGTGTGETKKAAEAAAARDALTQLDRCSRVPRRSVSERKSKKTNVS
ncbi:MAG: ribonuclease III [Coriobacteriia bacterium]|nr:ribonuclease III [Coriobacteriia bacterium]